MRFIKVLIVLSTKIYISALNKSLKLNKLMEGILKKLIEKQNLTQKESESCVEYLTSGNCTNTQVAAVLTALKMKGETAEEILGFVTFMRENSLKIPLKLKIVDNCGTGGDQSNTFNVSTASMFVAAGAGCLVAKHGNRASSSKCGSADILEKLGVKIDLPANQVKESIEKIGLGFVFAPAFHPIIKNIAQVRKELGIKTIFNIAGPLTNPASPKNQLIGVYEKSLIEKMMRVLAKTGSGHAIIAYGSGLDEVCLHAETTIGELKDGVMSNYNIKPEDFGIKRAKKEAIVVKSTQENMKLIKDVLKGTKGPARNIVLLNAGATIYVADNADSIKEGIEMAAVSIDSGKAEKKLELLKNFSEQYGHFEKDSKAS